MNLNRLQLPAYLVAELYRQSLVDHATEEVSGTTTITIEPASQSGDKWKYLGENRKNILIVVDHRNAFYLPDEDLTFLTAMLGACQLSLADVAIINRQNLPDTEYREYHAQLSSKIVFLFGVDPVGFGLPINFPQFQLQPFSHATFLFTPPLEEMRKDNLLKSKLWVSLRRLFNI